MAPFLFFFFVSLFGLAYGTYSDLKERLVSNSVTYGMLALGLAGHAVLAFWGQDVMIFAYSATVAAGAFLFSFLLYKAGVWAGGDVKLFTGLGALNPFNPALFARLGLLPWQPFGAVEIPVFPLTLFMFSLFAMLPYGAILAIGRLNRNEGEKKKFFAESRTRVIQSVVFAMAAVGLTALLGHLSIASGALEPGIALWLALPLLFAFAFVPGKAKGVVAVILLVFALWSDALLALEQLAGIFGLFLGVYLLFKLYSLSKILMRKPVQIEKLEEGMISAVTIVQRGNKVEIMPEMGIKRLIKYFASNKFGEAMQLMQPRGRVIVSSSRAGGLTKEEIKELRKLAAENRIGKSLPVKESAPFVPAVLIAYLALSIVGDVIWFWLF